MYYVHYKNNTDAAAMIRKESKYLSTRNKVCKNKESMIMVRILKSL
jgi:hypothetical protein